MIDSSELRTKRMPLSHGAGQIPALGFGTLIPDAAATISATRDALAAAGIAREDIFVTTKLWNTNHRPERVKPAFEASLGRLGLNDLDLYLIHTPFAFQPGDDQDRLDEGLMK